MATRQQRLGTGTRGAVGALAGALQLRRPQRREASSRSQKGPGGGTGSYSHLRREMQNFASISHLLQEHGLVGAHGSSRGRWGLGRCAIDRSRFEREVRHSSNGRGSWVSQ